MMVAFNYPLSILAYQLGEKIFTFYQKSRLNNKDFRERVSIIDCWYSVLDIFQNVFSWYSLAFYFQIENVYSDYLALYNKEMLTSVNHRELFQEALRRNCLESLVSNV